ncbi:unnamed protein product [Caenorhabditis auriculariae]|uniref:DUF8206 domain-containing protein n=1 Tax=Caenorhabditis auriculariae TaxID=2777116 RepID=A0A8S1HXI6_9PELO|nr:unnamed protein product [Caenorhabditis auriculariae]
MTRREGTYPEFIELAGASRRALIIIYNTTSAMRISQMEALVNGSTSSECQRAFNRWKNSSTSRSSQPSGDLLNSELFKDLPAQLRPYFKGKTSKEIMIFLENNLSKADKATLELFYDWMEKKFPGWKRPETWPQFVMLSTADTKKKLIDLLENQDLTKEVLQECLKLAISNESEHVKFEYQLWELVNSDEYPFLKLVIDSKEQERLVRILADPNDEVDVKIQKLRIAIDSLGNERLRMVFNSWERDFYDRSDNRESGRSLPKWELPKFFGQLQKTTNVLVLGETGVGKSTMINGLINYLNFQTLSQAADATGGHHVLIESSFTHYDQNRTKTTVHVLPTTTDPNGQNRSNENLMSSGESATQEPKDYIFEYDQNGTKKEIRIIDTPGIGDTRGIEQDRKNFNKIMQFLSCIDELHAILILMKPNQARLDLTFKFCVDELLVHLHKDAAKNIFFCFTNTRASHYEPGESLGALRTHLKSLDTRDVHIPLEQNYFCYDNECFRYLCAKSRGLPMTEREETENSESWDKAFSETKRLFERVAKTKVHKMSETLCLNNTRTATICLSRPLVEIMKLQISNSALIEKKIQEVENCKTQEDMLKLDLNVNLPEIKVEQLNRPNTVCTKCVSYVDVPGTDQKNTVYDTICHNGCFLSGVQVDTCPNGILRNCAAMNSTAYCQNCGCGWEKHMHIRYKITYVMKTEEDPEVNKMIADKGKTQETCNFFINKQKTKLSEMDAEVRKMGEYAVDFASFLKGNCMIMHNDSYRQSLAHEIEMEENKSKISGDKTLLKKLRDEIAKHDSEVALLNDSVKVGTKQPKSQQEVERMIRELSNLRHSGAQIEALKNMELMSAQESSGLGSTRIALKPLPPPDQKRKPAQKGLFQRGREALARAGY